MSDLICPNCQKGPPLLVKCSNCQLRYCSAKCKKVDKKTHKKICEFRPVEERSQVQFSFTK